MFYYAVSKGIKNRENAAMEHYKNELADDIEYHNFIQFLFFKQWGDVKRYANENGIKIIGDIPIFVAADSSDAWANPEIFLFDEERKPVKVAGVPPDYFSATGQLWGNPLYNWEKLKETNYSWWVERVRANLSTCDIIRIDHFRGFEAYWAVPYGDDTAINGQWEPGPGIDLFNAIKSQLGELPIIAEDLGLMTQGVIDLREATGFPGMKILGFAFDSGEENDYLPHTYTKNCVVYTGTHDNQTVVGFYQSKDKDEQKEIVEYFQKHNYDTKDIASGFVQMCLESIADYAILPVQDIMGLDDNYRMNTPGTLGDHNWTFKLTDFEDLKKRTDYIHTLLEKTNRL